MRNVYLDAHLKYKFVAIVKYVSITLHLSESSIIHQIETYYLQVFKAV